MQIQNHIRQIQQPPITEVKSWLAGRTFPVDKPLIDLCQAIPNYPPPPELITHLQACLNDPRTFTYSPDEGLPEVRQAVCNWYQRRYQDAPNGQQLCLTIGASQAFWLAICCLCRPGDEVILQSPAYFDHPMGLQALGIKAVFAPFVPANGGQPDVKTIAGLISPRTRAILLTTPSNPTGAVIPADTLNALFELAQQQQLALVLDETYNAFIAATPHRLLGRSDWPSTFVQIASFGKTFALTGLRCGALIAGEEMISQALKLQDSMAVCQPRPAQQALAYGCQQLDGWVADNTQRMQQRHDLFKTEFERSGSPFKLTASGSFFAWIQHPWPELTGRAAAKRLADQANLICLPGEAFGPGLTSYLRLAFGNIAAEQIPQAVQRFCD